MTQDITPQEAVQRPEQHFGGREGVLTQDTTAPCLRVAG
jgi:hypothetical protein